MNGNAIKNALTRKIGPLPAWGWFLIGGVALVIYRRRMSAAANSADQAQAAAANPAYYGPYGQDNYPIGGGSGMGGGGAGTDPGTTTTPAPPTIIVNQGGGGKGDKRTPKPKAQHTKANNKPTAAGQGKPKVPRYHATTHNGRQHPHSSGGYRDTSKHSQHTRSGGAGTAAPKRTRGKKR